MRGLSPRAFCAGFSTAFSAPRGQPAIRPPHACRATSACPARVHKVNAACPASQRLALLPTAPAMLVRGRFVAIPSPVFMRREAAWRVAAGARAAAPGDLAARPAPPAPRASAAPSRRPTAPSNSPARPHTACSRLERLTSRILHLSRALACGLKASAQAATRMADAAGCRQWFVHGGCRMCSLPDPHTARCGTVRKKCRKTLAFECA